jgi:AcrR family transcriptional regulator
MPKIVDRDQYRKELLNKCFELFALKGYGSISMRHIAESLGVSTGTLYHYFPSKKVLFEELVECVCEQDLLKAATELEKTQTLQERVEALGKYLVKNESDFIKWTYIGVDFRQHQDYEEMKDSRVFKRVAQRYEQAIYDYLEIEDPMLAAFISSLIDGWILERLWGNESVSIPEQCTLLGKMLSAYLEKQEQEKL